MNMTGAPSSVLEQMGRQGNRSRMGKALEDLKRDDTGHFPFGPFSDALAVRLSSVAEYFRREAAQAGLDMRPGVVASLAGIARFPGLSQAQLSALTRRDKSMVVNMLHDLEAQGWVQRRRSETDRRRHELRVTPAGREALERNLKILAEVEARLLRGMAPEAVALLRQLLEMARNSCDQAET